MLPSPIQNPRVRTLGSLICHLLSWTLFLWWYALQMPWFFQKLQQAGHPLSPELQAVQWMHPYPGVAAAFVVGLVVSWLSRKRPVNTFVNLQLLGILLAVSGIFWTLWGLRQTAELVQAAGF